MTTPNPAQVLTTQIGIRFIVATLLPNVYAVALIAGLLAAGAPAQRPSWQRLEAAIDGLSISSLVLLVIGLAVVSVILHPLQVPLIQLMEGYWAALPFGRTFLRSATMSADQRRAGLIQLGGDGSQDELTLAEARERLRWLPPRDQPVLPTRLGNVLSAVEFRAGDRYRHVTSAVWPALAALLSEEVRHQVADTRNQLDAAVKLCVVNLLAVPVTAIMLLEYDYWLLVPLACYLAAWMSYLASLAAAKRFGTALSAAFDLYHLRLWDGLGLERPDNVLDELNRNEVISRMLAGEAMPDARYESLRYARPAPPSQNATGSSGDIATPT